MKDVNKLSIFFYNMKTLPIISCNISIERPKIELYENVLEKIQSNHQTEISPRTTMSTETVGNVNKH